MTSTVRSIMAFLNSTLMIGNPIQSKTVQYMYLKILLTIYIKSRALVIQYSSNDPDYFNLDDVSHAVFYAK